MSTTTRDHAVVLGAGMAGLLAARVLADEYARVTIVDRDRFPDGPEHRRGVPQAHHVHALLPRGRQVAEELLPGLTGELIEAGAVAGDILGNARWYLHGRRLRSVDAGLTAVSASRPLIEGTIRRRVLALPNVTLLDGYDIVGVCSTVDGHRVTGARVTSLTGAGSRVLPAGLVLDCTGRGSRASRWLTELGYVAPVEDRVTIDLRYASRLFEVAPEVFGNDIAVVTARFPGQLRGAVMQRIEGARVLVSLTGVRGERPPTNLAAFGEYARTLSAPDTYEAVRTGRPIGDAVTFRVPTYLRRRYDQLTDLPLGLLVAGDAACAFNPVYAQGMSVAAATMAVLRDELGRGGDPDPVRFYAASAELFDVPWGMGVGGDMSLPGITAPPMPASPLTPQYLSSLQLAAVEDGELAKAFIRVTALVDPPRTLLRPELVERVRRAAQPRAQPGLRPAARPLAQPVA